MAAKNYRDLIAWQKAMDLAELVYKVTGRLPDEERYGLTSQLRRASVSVASNIAEGQGRFTDADFHRFLSIAHGSVREVETQLLLAARLGLLSHEEIDSAIELSAEVGRLIAGLARSLKPKA
ncbi:four helix bundle protein [Botrimarina sp.]|uniref:four helix bundle protein n=1 Tax=Botrimarina sp. TaxID=2795802 RepID=UPI0032EEF282